MDPVVVRRDTTEKLPLEHSMAKLSQLFKDSDLDLSERSGSLSFHIQNRKKFDKRLDTLLGDPDVPLAVDVPTSPSSGRFTVYTGVENGVPFVEASGPAALKTSMENLLKVLLQVYAGFYRCASDVLSDRRDAPQPPPSVAVAVAEDSD